MPAHRDDSPAPTGSARSDAQGIGALLRTLAGSSAELVRQEVRLARVEFSQVLDSVGRGTAFVASGGVLLLIGALAFLTGVVLLPGDQWLHDRYWLAALVVCAVAGGLAAWMAARGRRRLRAEALLPTQTIATLTQLPEITHGRHSG